MLLEPDERDTSTQALVRRRGHRPVVSRVHWRVPVTPGRGLLELAGDPDEDVLTPVSGYQLDADRVCKEHGTV